MRSSLLHAGLRPAPGSTLHRHPALFRQLLHTLHSYGLDYYATNSLAGPLSAVRYAPVPVAVSDAGDVLGTRDVVQRVPARFPFRVDFEVEPGVVLSSEQIIDMLAPTMLEERVRTIERVGQGEE